MSNYEALKYTLLVIMFMVGGVMTITGLLFLVGALINAYMDLLVIIIFLLLVVFLMFKYMA